MALTMGRLDVEAEIAARGSMGVGFLFGRIGKLSAVLEGTGWRWGDSQFVRMDRHCRHDLTIYFGSVALHLL